MRKSNWEVTGPTRSTVLRHGIGLGLAALALGSPRVQAVDWEFYPQVTLSGLHDDNYTLTETAAAEVEVSGGAVGAEVELTAATPRTQFSLTPRFRSTYFPDETEQESNDYYADMRFQFAGQTYRIGLRADYSHEAVVASELPGTDFDPDLGPVDGGDTGLVTTRNRRDQMRVLPSMAFDLTERLAIEVGGRYLDVNYDRVVPGDQEGYRDTKGDLGFTYDLSERSALSLMASASSYEAEVSATDSDTYSLLAKWAWQFSETQRAYLAAGGTRTDFDDVPGQPTGRSETNFTGGAGTSWQYQLTRIFLDLTYGAVPNASGEVIEREELRFRLSRFLTPRVSVFLNARGILANELGAQTSTADRKYAVGTVGLEWRILRQLSLVGDYEYQWQEFDVDPTDATSNSVTLSLVYEPRRRD